LAPRENELAPGVLIWAPQAATDVVLGDLPSRLDTGDATPAALLSELSCESIRM
jgi:hypothetical protein